MNEKVERNEALVKKTVCLFMRANKMHKAAFSKFASDFGMHRGQHRMLMFICNNGGKVSQKEIAEAMDVSPAAITVMLNKLQETGYVTRAASEQDNRINLISPTEKAVQLVQASHRYFDNLDRTMLASFDERSLKTLCTAFEKMIDNLEDISDGE